MLRRGPRPRLTLAILGWAAVDVAGLVSLSAGALFLVRDQSFLLRSFPSTTGEALACVTAGLGLMLWAAARLLREVIKQAPTDSREAS